jgi:hypothetical protein
LLFKKIVYLHSKLRNLITYAPPPHIFANIPGKNPTGDKNGLSGNSRFPFISKYAYFQYFIISLIKLISAKNVFADAKMVFASAKLLFASTKKYFASANECFLSANECFVSANECFASANECFASANECFASANECFASANECFVIAKAGHLITITNIIPPRAGIRPALA